LSDTNALGWALWTGIVAVVFVQILPEAKERRIRWALDAYEAAPRHLLLGEGRGDVVTRVYPLTEPGRVIAFVLAVLVLGEPATPTRLLGTLLTVAGIVLVR
jgi:hypothetical protein